MRTVNIFMLAMSVIMMMSCKKEGTKEVDNPNIVHRVIDKEIIATSDITYDFGQVDMDNNGTADFVIELNLQAFAKSVRLLGFDTGDYSIAKAATSEDPYITTNLSSAARIDSAASDWTQLSFLAIYNNAPGMDVLDAGYAGKGDVLAGVQFLIDGKKHFGWLLINISANRKYVIVKETAYDIRPNMPINAGDK